MHLDGPLTPEQTSLWQHPRYYGSGDLARVPITPNAAPRNISAWRVQADADAPTAPAGSTIDVAVAITNL